MIGSIRAVPAEVRLVPRYIQALVANQVPRRQEQRLPPTADIRQTLCCSNSPRIRIFRASPRALPNCRRQAHRPLDQGRPEFAARLQVDDMQVAFDDFQI